MPHISPHKLPSEFRLKRILDTDIGKIYFYGNILVFEGIEGITLSYKSGFSVLLRCLAILGNQRWVYISDRKNSYATKPIDFKYLNNIPTLKAIGVVSYSELGLLNGGLESKFCAKPYEIFTDFEEAMIWAKTYL